MPLKIRLLLAGTPAGGLIPLLEAERDRLDKEFPGQLDFVIGKRNGDRELELIAAGDFGVMPCDFDAIMEIVLKDEAVLKPFAASMASFGQRFSKQIDAAKSTVMAGQEFVIIPGTGPSYVLICNRHLPHLSHDQFLQIWHDNHAPLAVNNGSADIGMRYRQFHNDIGKAADLAVGMGLGVQDFDGAAECYYDSGAIIRDLMAHEEIVEEATEDEKKFVDHDRCVTALFSI
jgi:hypothetical protein